MRVFGSAALMDCLARKSLGHALSFSRMDLIGREERAGRRSLRPGRCSQSLITKPRMDDSPCTVAFRPPSLHPLIVMFVPL